MEASALAPLVAPEGRLGDPDRVLRDEARVHPKLLETLDRYGFAGRAAPLGLTPDSPKEDQLRHVAEAQVGFEGLYEEMPNDLPSDRDEVDVTHETVPAEDGHSIDLRIYRKRGQQEAAPCVIYLHGGAMTMLSAFNKVHRRWCEDIAATGVVTIGVDFRNAYAADGGHPFPTGLNDCSAAVQWVHARREELGITKIVLMGESGGGNLALATTIKARRDGTLDAIDGVYATVPYISGGYGWDAARKAEELPSLLASDEYFISCESMAILVATYDPTGANAENPLAWPYFAREEDLVGLPPHVIVVEELDPLRDEGMAYYRKLLRAGVRVVGRMNLGMVHAAEMIFRQAVPDDYFMTVDDIKRFALSV